MKGKPKFKFGDIVRFNYKDIILEGMIYIIDEYGTIEQHDDVSYDIKNIEENILYKHIEEKYVVEKIGNIWETDRILLRHFTMEDAEPMYRNWASSYNVTRYLTWPAHGSVEVTEAVIYDWIEGYKEGDILHWAIVLKEINEPIGSIGVVRQKPGIKCAELGYCMGEKWWGQGIMPEALTMVVNYLFGVARFNRVEAGHDSNNPNSGKVMAKAGLLYEGTHKSSGLNNQGVIDEVIYGLTRDDWISQHAARLDLS